MVTTIQDVRTVKVQVSLAELQTLLVTKARQQGIIDFDPDRIQIYENGDDSAGNTVFEILFEKDTPDAP